MNDVMGQLRKLALQCDGGPTDGQLLECFHARRDETAFEELMRRHGAMVLGVCRRVLGNHHDAEDAFQATFLVLARKGAGLRARELVGNWLHGVAYRTALRAKAMSARRQAHEQKAQALARPEPPADGWQDLLPLLDREVDGLPERYRVALVHCDLQGLTRREAARQLGVPEGTLSGRLTRARRLLARRMARYGPAPSGGALAVILAKQAAAQVPSPLAISTARAAVLAAGQMLTAGAVPARVAALTEGIIKTMLLTRLKSFVAVVFVVIASAAAIGLAHGTSAAKAGPAGDQQRPSVDDLEALRLEVEALRLEVGALRKGIHATQERVKTLEAEVHAGRRNDGGEALPKGAHQVPAAGPEANALHSLASQELAAWTKYAFRAQPADDPLADAEAALKAIRAARDRESHQRATDALEKALKWLKEGERPRVTMDDKYSQALLFIHKTWPGLDAAGLKAKMAEARDALAQCKRVGDTSSARKLQNITARHIEELSAELKKLSPAINIDDERPARLIKEVRKDLLELTQSIDDFLATKADVK
jgi:RNA polymerase sigma factor (sigma-70 family)